MSDARTILERMVRAEWALSEAFDADGLHGGKEAGAIADKAWGTVMREAVAFLEIERPENPFEEQEVPMSAENREVVKRNMDNWLAAMMEKDGLVYCPSCHSVVSKADIKTGEI